MNKRTGLFAIVVILVVGLSACKEKFSYKYETVADDPLKARIYTLNNGLKVYMTVNKEIPRIQTYIAVRVGAKNDPKETTGLAHYFEHLMFKGTTSFGTQNYEQEKPLLDRIEQRFEVYRKTTDERERQIIYKEIDSLSYEASKLAIPNEYDKLMATIGADGTNAYTGFDETVYVEDIPSNQIENWAKIQADRFAHAVIRGFHTELETVYEEKNMSLTNDFRKMYEAVLAGLFPHHPYGTQTVLGTQEDLKNPSITNIKKYYNTWYVPNNMAICLSGDFNPEKMIEVIDTYFGKMKGNDSLPQLHLPVEEPIVTPVKKEVLGPDAESLMLGWRFPGAAGKQSDLLAILGTLLSNGRAGLIDLNLIQQQKILNAEAMALPMADYCALLIVATPKQRQTLEQTKELLLEQIARLRSGDFDEEILTAIVNNFKLEELYELEDNESRAHKFVESFIYGTPWSWEVGQLNRMSKVTKQQIVDFANKYLQENYVVVYKREGKDPKELKIRKPEITPIVMNRDTSSAFLREIQLSHVAPIEPVFLDFSKDMSRMTVKPDIPVLYKQNSDNGLFELIYLFEFGRDHDKALETVFHYLDYLGTSKLTREQINREFYRLACTFSVSVDRERAYISLSGLGENMHSALLLLEDVLADAQADRKAYDNLVTDILKGRTDAKLNQGQNFNRLVQYALWGPNGPATHMMSAEELRTANPQSLVDYVRRLNDYEHRILYYGPKSPDELVAILAELHRVPEKLNPVPVSRVFAKPLTIENKVLLAQYDAKQIYLSMVSNRGEKYDASIEPVCSLYNEYFGGDMNSVVFQEIREARGLAYTAKAVLASPSRYKDPYVMQAFIATQNDKMLEALNAFNDIINNMPESEYAFGVAKEGLLSRLRTQRITKADVLWTFIAEQDLESSVDSRKVLFEQARQLTLKDVKAFQEKWIKGRCYTYCILGNEKDLDLTKLAGYGPVRKLTSEEVFGY